jgi:hypothetical protein
MALVVCQKITDSLQQQHAAFISEILARTGPRYVGAPGRLIIWRSFKPTRARIHTHTQLFVVLNTTDEIFRVCVLIGNNFHRNSSTCGSPSLPAPYFRLFQLHLCSQYRFVPRAVFPVTSAISLALMLMNAYRITRRHIPEDFA